MRGPVAGLSHRTIVVPALVLVWAAVVPYLTEAAGLRLEVDRSLEVIDHVIPSVLALGAVAAGLPGARPGSWRWLAAAAVVILAGLWIATTHVALVAELVEGTVGAATALLHLSAGPPVVAAGLWLLLASPDAGTAGTR